MRDRTMAAPLRAPAAARAILLDTLDPERPGPAAPPPGSAHLPPTAPTP
jgi:hypothetical protein